MIELQLTVPNKLGLHARAAAKLVTLASRLDIFLEVSKDNANWTDARNIMGLLMLGASKGTLLSFRIDGRESTEARAQLIDLFARNFDEDQT